MKKILLTLAFAVVAFIGIEAHAQSQQVALIDMQYLMTTIPEAKSATQKIQTESEKLGKEIKALQESAQKKYLQYQKERASLSASDRLKLENEIVSIEEKAKDLQQKYFGPQGTIAKMQESLIKPINDNIYEAVKLIAQRRGYLVVLDRASAQNVIIFADPQADISNDVLAVLGYSN